MTVYAAGVSVQNSADFQVMQLPVTFLNCESDVEYYALVWDKPLQEVAAFFVTPEITCRLHERGLWAEKGHEKLACHSCQIVQLPVVFNCAVYFTNYLHKSMFL